MNRKIKVLLKRPTENESLILLVYRYNGKKLVMSIGEKVLIKYWNFDKMKVRETKDYPDFLRINAAINNWIAALSKAITTFEVSNSIPTILELKELTRQNRFLSSNHKNKYPVGVYKNLEAYVANLKLENKLNKSTIQSWDQLYNSLSGFTNIRSIEFKDLTLPRLKKIITYWDKKGYTKGQINKLQRRLIQFLKYFEDLGIPLGNGYKSKSWKVNQPKVSGNDFALTLEEIEKIRVLKLQGELEPIRDRLLLGIYTGQRYSDFKSLSRKDFFSHNGILVINIRQNKTKKLVQIPLTTKIRGIFDKYNGDLPTYSLAFFNKKIKTIAEEAGIIDEIPLEVEYLNRIERIMVRKCDIISSHCCRRTACTVMINKGMPLSEVMKITGHQNLKTLSTYIKRGLEISKDTQNIYEDLF